MPSSASAAGPMQEVIQLVECSPWKRVVGSSSLPLLTITIYKAMKRDEIKNKITKIVAACRNRTKVVKPLAPEDITEEMTFKQLELDSIDLLDTVIEVEKEFGFEVNEADCDFKTIGEVVDAVDKEVNRK